MTEGIRDLLAPTRDDCERLLDARFPGIGEVFEKRLPVVIYGAARMGRVFHANLERAGIATLAFGDGSPATWDARIGDARVLPPDRLAEEHRHRPVLIASLMYETEIQALLRGKGFTRVYPLCFLNHRYPDIFVSPEYRDTFDSTFDAAAHDRIGELFDALADDESRNVLRGLIRFRRSFDKDHILSVRSGAPQYFDDRIVRLSPGEVFFDCGAYTGDTVQAFFAASGGRFRRIYAFEPDPSNFEELCRKASALDPGRIVPVRRGLHSAAGNLLFMATGSIDARVGADGNAVSVPVTAIDDFASEAEAPTFIKMDIEGSERDALLGARRTLAERKPILAVSAYHHARDLWEIPLMIRALNGTYRLFLRHYTNEIIDTVCYAV